MIKYFIAFGLNLIIIGCAQQRPTEISKPNTPTGDELVTFPSTDGKISGPSSYSVNILSKSQLKHCIDLNKIVEQTNDDIDAQRQKLEKRRKEIELEASDVEKAHGTVDTHSQKSVDTFNTRLEGHSLKINSYNQDIVAHQLVVSRNNGNINEFNLDCAGHSYRKSDLDIVAPGWRQSSRSKLQRFQHQSVT